jgi:hypothetical protein
MDALKPKVAFKAAELKIREMGGVPKGTRIVEINDANRLRVTLKFFMSVADYEAAADTYPLDAKTVKAVNALKNDEYIILYTLMRFKWPTRQGLRP